MKEKFKKTISRLAVILLIGMLTGIAIYIFRQPKPVEEETITPQPKTETKKNVETKTEKTVDVSEILETPSNSDSNVIEEKLPDSFSEKIEEGKIAETIENRFEHKKELNSIYIPLTKSLFSASDASINVFRNRIMQSEPPVRAKIYYQGENGLIESLLSLDEKGAIHETLFSYDPAGNPVDKLEIGLLVPDSSEKKYATISVNKLSVFELTSTLSADKRQERVTEYFITPQLRFKKGRTFSRLL